MSRFRTDEKENHITTKAQRTQRKPQCKSFEFLIDMSLYSLCLCGEWVFADRSLMKLQRLFLIAEKLLGRFSWHRFCDVTGPMPNYFGGPVSPQLQEDDNAKRKD